MSGFGVKTPARREIVTNDFMFNSSEELFSFLELRFADDSKHYVNIASETSSEFRSKKGKGILISGCLKSSMISIFQNGECQIKHHLCNCEYCFLGQFSKCTIDKVSHEIELIDEIMSLDETDNIPNDMHLFIEEGSYVGVYSSGKSLELFYVIKIIEKCVAEDDISDIYGHIMQSGATYFKGYYLEKIDSSRRDILPYKQHKKIVYIYLAEIFYPAIAMSSQLTLSIEDYIFISDAV